MKLPAFEVEQWMTAYEHDAVYNLTDTCIPALTVSELLELDDSGLFHDVTLDYGTISGDLRLREAILNLYATGSPDDITTSQGCLEGNELVMNTLLEPQDHVITFAPGYQAFMDYPRSIGCKVTVLPLYEEDGWQPHIEDLEEAMKAPVKLIILNNPNNPTGTLFRKDYLDRMIDLANEQDTWILSDEVYRDPANPSLSDLYENGISVSSLSKMYSLAGLRLGWIKGPRTLIDQINERRDYSIISTGPLADTLGFIALRKKDVLLERSRSIIAQNRTIIREWLETESRCHVVIPEGCAVSFLQYDPPVPSKDLAVKLLKDYGVFFVPGACFGYENHMRLSLTASEDIMKTGLRLLSECLDSLSQ